MYKGLFDEFGGDRVLDTPISEAGIVGLGVGAAATGLRPMIDIMFMDFLGKCMDEVTNQMAKMRFMFGGKATLPMTLLTMAGAGASMGAQHSQSLEVWLAHLPGLKVVMPATPYDVKGLILGAAREDNPVIVIMNKLSLGITGEVPEDAYCVPLGRADIARPGTNFTIVATGRMRYEALEAAEALQGDGVDADPGAGFRPSRCAGGPGRRALLARAVQSRARAELPAERHEDRRRGETHAGHRDWRVGCPLRSISPRSE
jgi:pyruvate dehydrogenase E1 component beta subunit